MSTHLKKQADSSSNFLLVPIVFAIAVIPLLVKFVIYDPQLTEYSWYTSTTKFTEMFTYYKRNAMMFLDGILVLGFSYLFFKKELPKAKAFIPLAVYFVLIFLSSLVSVSPYHTWNGFPDMLESTFVLFGYCMICYYTYAVVKTEQQLKIVFFAFLISIFILSLIGFSQFINIDFFMTDFGKSLIFSDEYRQYRDGISQSFEAGRVSSTLYNPNYVGVYSCIVIPILLTLTFTIKEKKYLPLYFVLLALVLCCLIGSGSKTAILILIPCILFMAIYFGRKLGKKMIAVIAVFILAFTALNIYQGENSVFIKALDRLTAGYTPDKEYALKNITLNDDHFTITYEDTVLTASYEKAENDTYLLNIQDENNRTIPILYSEEKDHYYLEDEAYNKLAFLRLTISNKHVGYVIESEGYKFNICYSPTDQTYYYLNDYGRYTKLYSSPTFDIPLFHLMGGFSGRDYIWAKSIPILKETIFLGSGPDTYAFMFPQYDYIEAAQGSFSEKIITKPHNTYLQIGIQTGILSLIAYLAFYMIYFIESIRLYGKLELSTFTERCGAGIFISSACYMIAGLINDSTIGVSIVFWTLLGIGYACNHSIKSTETPSSELAETGKKEWKMSHILIICISFIGLVFAAHYIQHINDREPTDGRAIFETDAIGMIKTDDTTKTESIPYQAVMSTEWTFPDGKSISSDAYVENSSQNTHNVYFDVKLESGDILYTSPVIEVGKRLEQIALQKELPAGNYPAVVTYHLLNEDGTEAATAQISIVIKIMN